MQLENSHNTDNQQAISSKAFSGFKKLIFESAGITMSDAKKSLVAGRLGKRLRILNLQSYDDYLKYLTVGEGVNNGEFQIFVDSLTTNETYFFREPQHFDFLKQEILKKHKPDQLLRIWSSASSSGEEAYTLAMILADELGIDAKWEILGTDISTEMISSAKQAIYNEHRVRLVPKDARHKYLLKGTGSNKGYVAVVPELKKHVRFEHYNLVDSPLRKEMFDVIFCRNVLIYFSQETKKIVMQRLYKQLKHGSYLMTGHSESLHGMISELRSVKPSVYLKTGNV
ncbi:MAG: SAM-dependent methyltransferase [endosymbiont of Galathealinum brachiosum]|uniref:Chemotaxis protein methyltransferase n=1 Tax=endosymbiont of Galathealinum brachiosum TaxID=2200906 RepID=A0A370DL96_9GAMM|nr:MAG: SAM-dependent methyltransferase [endosymbiont of Galathealinum brachiosum]